MQTVFGIDSIDCTYVYVSDEQMSQEEKELLARTARERADIVNRYDKV